MSGNEVSFSSSVPDMTNSENSASSNSSGEGGNRRLDRKMSSPHLSENIMRKIDRDPYDVYEHAKVLGTGSMVRYNVAFMFMRCVLEL